MVESSSGGAAKLMMILLNLLYFLGGGAMLGIAVWMKLDGDFFFGKFLNDDNPVIIYVLMVIGGVGIIFALLGCVSSGMESVSGLGAYIAFICLLIIGEVVIGVLILMDQSASGRMIDKIGMDLGKDKYATAKPIAANNFYTDMGKMFNVLQQKYDCCGIRGAKDYAANANINAIFSQNVPYACCQKIVTGATEDNPIGFTAPCNAYTKDCKKDIHWAYLQNTNLMIGLLWGMACLQCFGIIFGTCLCGLIRMENKGFRKY